MTCDERRDLLLLYVTGGLDPVEHEALRAHLAAGCSTCAASLAEANAVVAQMAEAVAPVRPPADAINKLMHRIGERRRDDIAARIVPAPTTERAIAAKPRESTSWKLFAAILTTAAASIAITAGALLYATRHQRAFWGSSDLTIVALASKTEPNARGQLWWDREHRTGRIVVNGASTPTAGREYELWFIPAGGKPIRSQTFRVDQAGAASIVVDVPASVASNATAAITDEPFGGVDAPTGSIHLAGAMP